MNPSQSPPTLFPSVGEDTMTGSSTSAATAGGVKTLFAVAQRTDIVDEVLSSAKSNMSWLTNTSFDPSHAAVVHQRTDNGQKAESRSSATVAQVVRDRIVAQDDIKKDKKKKKHKKCRSRSRSTSRERERRRSRSRSRDRKRRSRSRDKRRSRSRERKRHRRSRSSSRTRKHKKRKKAKRKAERRSDSSEISPSRGSASPPRAIFTDDLPDLAPEYRYRQDRRPDRQNLTYGSLYKMNVARYWRLGNLCLGSEPDRPVFVKENSHKMEKSAFSKRLYISDLGEKVYATTKLRTDDYMIVNDGDGNEVSEVNPLGVYDDKTEQWLQGKGGLDLGPEPAVNVKTAIDLEIEEYNKYLREYPRDVDKWLQFVRYQDEFLKSNRRVKEGASEDMESRKVSEHLVIRKKLAILEKALKTNSGNVVLETLRLELSRSVLEPEQLRTEWRTFVLAHLDEPAIWRSFITYHQCDLNRFTVRETMAVYGKCLATFNKLKTREMREWVVPLDVEYQMLDIFCRLCRFLRQTGHTERAIAAYQAMVELNLRPPASVSSPGTDHEIKLAVFEPYWDAGAPRLGEEGAPGWARWVREREDVFKGSPEDEDDDYLLKDETQRKASVWLRLETRRESTAWLPWRPDLHQGQGQEDMADFDRVVLFDDIVSFLFTLQEPSARVRLLSEFLNFLGVEIARSSRSLLGVGDCQTGLECNDHLTNHGQRQSDQEFIMRILENYSELSSSDSKLSALDTVVMDYFSSRVKSAGKVTAKAYKKFAKRILQKEQNRNRHDLWLKFAELERLTGNMESCIKVLLTVLCQTTDGAISPNVHKYYIRILLGIDSELEDIFSKRTIAESDKDDVVNLCSCLAQGSLYDPSRKQSSSIVQLKTRRDFVDKLSKLKTSLFWTTVKDDRLDEFRSQLSDYLANVFSFAVFQLLTVGHDKCDVLLTETERLLNNGFRSISQRENFDELHRFYESFHEDRIQVTVLSVTLGSRPLSVLRRVVTSALDTFPDNARFIRWLARLEARSSFAGRWRRYVDEKAGAGETARLWVAAVETELAKLEGDGKGSVEVPTTGLVYRIRALFERATASETGRFCILMWRMYMKFEFKNGDLDRTKAIFYKALQQCPWAKPLYLDAVEYFPADLEEITDLMLEKGLRLRCIPEEIDIVVE